MKYSTNAIRRVSILALVLIGLLQAPSGPTPVQRERVLAAWDGARARLNHERLFSRRPRGADQKTIARSGEAYSKLPIRFEANDGQTDAKVKFLSRSAGYGLFLTQSEAVLTLRSERSGSNDVGAQSIVRMKLIGADPAPRMESLDRLPGRSNYIIGKDANRWRRNVESFAKVRYHSVYPGIDLIYYGNQRQLEYDFVVAPEADPSMIRLSFDGADQIQIDAQGDLVLKTASGEVRQRKPVAYQEADGSRREIASRYALRGGQEVGFELGEYDRAHPLVIDPVMNYSTYLGGSSFDHPDSIAVDAAGNAYVTGQTFSVDFPTSNPLQPNPGGNGDVFVTKLNPEGSALVYSTYLGGSNLDGGFGIAVDDDGNAYVAGQTQSLDFPTKNALQPELAGGMAFIDDVFVTKLNPDGSELVYSTYLGGTGSDNGFDLAIDNERNVYVAGNTFSSDFPTVNPLQATRASIFAAKIKVDGSALVYSTYLGGTSPDVLHSIAVDGFGCLYLTGFTFSTDFPTANPLKSTLGGDLDGFVTKISADGSAFVYSTYLGGDAGDSGNDITVDAEGAAYVTGGTTSANFPTVNPLQPVFSGLQKAFVTKINRSGSAILYSTYLGGTVFEAGSSIAIDSRNNIYVSGLTLSDDFPTLDAAQPRPDSNPAISGGDGFVTSLKADGSGLIYSTYLGGKANDIGYRIAADARGSAYVLGITDSDDLPTTPGTVQREPSGGLPGAFITRISAPRRHHHNHDKDREGDDDGNGHHSRRDSH